MRSVRLVRADERGIELEYDAFISYSHAADGRLAPAIQNGLQRLAKPWHQRRALRVFRDETGLSVNPHLWDSIVDALDSSRWFIVLASPASAASVWVDREVAHFLASRPDARDRLLPVVTEGTWEWDESTGGFSDATDCVPPALLQAFESEPRHLDLSWARSEEQLHLRRADFRAAIADIAAPIHGVPKDELESEDIRIHQRNRRLRRGAVGALSVLTIGLAVATFAAIDSRNEARDLANDLATTNSVLADTNDALESSLEAEQDARDDAEARAVESRSRELAARSLNTVDTDPHLAALLAVEGLYPAGVVADVATDDARAALGVATRALTTPAFVRVSDPVDGSLAWSAVTPNRLGRFVVERDDDLDVWAEHDVRFGSVDPSPLFTVLGGALGSADLSPDGTRLLVADRDGVRAYDVDEGTTEWEVPPIDGRRQIAGFSDDGTVAAIIGDAGLALIDTSTGVSVTQFDSWVDGLVGPSLLVDLGRDGTIIAVAGDPVPDDGSDGDRRTLQVIDVASRSVVTETTVDRKIDGLMFFGDDDVVLVDQDGQVSVWWISQQQANDGASVGARVLSVPAWSPSRDRLALLDLDGRLTVLRIDFPANVMIESTLVLPVRAGSVRWIDDTTLVVDDPGGPGVTVFAATSDGSVDAVAADGSIVVIDRDVIDSENGTPLWSLEADVFRPFVSRTGQYVAAERGTEMEHIVEIHDGRTGELLAVVPVTNDGTHEFVGDGDRIVSWNGGGIRVWSSDDGTVLVDTSGPAGTSYWSFAADPSGERALVQVDETEVAVVDLWTGEDRPLAAFDSEITATGWTNDAGVAMVGLFDRTVRMIDVADGSTVGTYAGLVDAPYAVAMSDDGERLVAVTQETAKFWDLATGTPLDTIEVTEQTLGVVAAPDGSGFWQEGLTSWRHWPDADPLLACELALPAAAAAFEAATGSTSVCEELINR